MPKRDFHHRFLLPSRNKNTVSSRKYVSTLKGRYAKWKAKAKVKKIPFNLTYEELNELYVNQNGKCFYTGKTLLLEPGTKYTISLDRINSKDNYTKDNVVLCCWDINCMKNTLDINTFIKLCNFVSWIHPVDRRTI